MKFVRPDWNDYFLGIATAVAERSDCRRSKVGAVLVDGAHRILSTGYVGVAPGDPGCLAGACPRGLKTFDEVKPYSPYNDCISTHAEINCFKFASTLHDTGQTDLKMYVTRAPCVDCISIIWFANPDVEFIYPEVVEEQKVRAMIQRILDQGKG